MSAGGSGGEALPEVEAPAEGEIPRRRRMGHEDFLTGADRTGHRLPARRIHRNGGAPGRAPVEGALREEPRPVRVEAQERAVRKGRAPAATVELSVQAAPSPLR